MPYRSTVDNVCHACGHDVHTTILLGAGLALAQLAERGELPGRVRLLFQPAEETIPSGAPEVIAAGGAQGRRRDLRPALRPAAAGRAWSGCAPARSPRPPTRSRSGSPAAAGTPPART